MVKYILILALQEINLPLEAVIEKSILFSTLFWIENRKFIKGNQKLKMGGAEQGQKLTQ